MFFVKPLWCNCSQILNLTTWTKQSVHFSGCMFQIFFFFKSNVYPTIIPSYLGDAVSFYYYYCSPNISHIEKNIIFWDHVSNSFSSHMEVEFGRPQTWHEVVFCLDSCGFLLGILPCTPPFSIFWMVNSWTLTIASMRNASRIYWIIILLILFELL